MKTHAPIPHDWPVQPVEDLQSAIDPGTCGHCGLTWDDGVPTSMTPSPAARCPFEAFHIYTEKQQRLEEARRCRGEARWEEDAIYGREDWRQDVANSYTQLGYWDWVIHNIESEEEQKEED